MKKGKKGKMKNKLKKQYGVCSTHSIRKLKFITDTEDTKATRYKRYKSHFQVFPVPQNRHFNFGLNATCMSLT